ncbi:MAG: pyrimidine 5'-nucleotidase [Caulobacteraceae bacterium]|nr:pyrimidine 5'-nucleotidase [Caulobacteraceae bacterium]
MSADLRHIDTWIFDLDNTLYPLETGFMRLIEERMTDYFERFSGLPRDEARALQKRYYKAYGTSLAGLIAEHDIDAHAFLAEVHDVPLDSLSPDPALRGALARLPGRRLVFTNGSSAHARRVLAHLALDDLFEGVFAIEAADLLPKPAEATFARMIAAFHVDPAAAAFFEDSERNLEPAARLGMTAVLVGDHAAASTASFVHHRTAALAPFLDGVQVQEIAA